MLRVKTKRNHGIKMMYLFLTAPMIYNPEVTIYDKNHRGSALSGLSDPLDMISMNYRADINMPEYKEFELNAKKNNCFLNGIASLDPDDSDRIVLSMFESEGSNDVIIMVSRPHNREDRDIEELVNYLYLQAKKQGFIEDDIISSKQNKAFSVGR